MSEVLIQLRAIAAGIRVSRRQVLLVGLVLGLLLGLTSGLLVGWVAWPVGYAGEVSVSQVLYVGMVADLFAFDHNQERTRRAMDWPDAAAVTCSILDETADEGQRVRLWMVLLVMNEDCQ